MTQNNDIFLRINEQMVAAKPGQTILDVARQNGIQIPTLCDFPGLPSHGSCRLCVVEIAGRSNTPTACTTPVEDGMAILTHSPRVMALRRELLQMLMAEHPSGCLFCPNKDHCDECMVTLRKAGVTTGCGSCPKDGQCELQSLAEAYQVNQPGYPIRYRMLPVETRDPFIDRDPNLCVLCGRCIRVCQEYHEDNTLSYSGRGAQALVSTAFHRSLLDANCTFCGSCVEICPTGAITEKTRKWEGLPLRETSTTCPFCSIGCQIQLLPRGERVIGSLPDHPSGTNYLCVNGRFAITELVDPVTRLKQPHHTNMQAWQPTGWEEAAQIVAEKLAACPPGLFEMRVSASCSNEDLYVAWQFAREVMHSRPVLASVMGRYGSALGSLARLLQASLPVEQLAGTADAVLCIGFDDRYAQSVVPAYLTKARRRGVKVIHTEAGQALPETASGLLAAFGAPAILVSAAALAGPQNALLLRQVEALAQSLGVRVSVLPEEGNLAGALRLGLAGTPDSTDDDSSVPAVLYLIGEPLPEKPADGQFIIAHALELPPGGTFDGLLLPAATFSEGAGTSIDYAGRLRSFHPAVPPPGEALPAWQILTRIARQMGAAGFDYTCLEEIQQAAQARFPGFPAHPGWPEIGEVARAPQVQSAGWHEPSYMGLPLSGRIAGLRSLYPNSRNARAHE